MNDVGGRDSIDGKTGHGEGSAADRDIALTVGHDIRRNRQCRERAGSLRAEIERHFHDLIIAAGVADNAVFGVDLFRRALHADALFYLSDGQRQIGAGALPRGQLKCDGGGFGKSRLGGRERVVAGLQILEQKAARIVGDRGTAGIFVDLVKSHLSLRDRQAGRIAHGTANVAESGLRAGGSRQQQERDESTVDLNISCGWREHNPSFRSMNRDVRYSQTMRGNAEA